MSNIKRIQDKLIEKGLDGVLVLSEVNQQYTTGFPSTDGAVVVTRDKAYFFTDSRYIEAAEMAIKDAVVEVPPKGKTIRDRVKETVEKHGVKKLGIEENSMSVAAAESYGNLLAPAQLVPAQDIFGSLRAQKTEDELESLIAAQRIAEKALADVLTVIKPGMTEQELMAELTYRMLKFGSEKNSFDPIVITGAKTSMPHGVPGDVVIKEGDFITMDFGCTKNGYCSDMTRTVAVGYATDEMRKVYDIVLQAQLAGIAAAKAGVAGRDIDAAARKVITDAGYGQYFGHSFGHSLGLEIHEAPNAAPSNDKPMPVGAVISAEPGIYIPGKFGVRIEDVVYLTETGCVNITKAPKELIIV